MAIYGTTAFAQEVPMDQPATAVTEPAVATHFDAAYEDNGVKVYITKVFPEYRMKDGQKITTLTMFFRDSLKEAGFQYDNNRFLHSVTEDTAELFFSPVIAGTSVGIARVAAHENTNKVIGTIGAVAMFAISRGSSGGTGALSNLAGLRDVVGSGMLKSGNFRDAKIETSEAEGIQVGEDDIIYIATAGIRYKQNENALMSTLYFVMPKEMKGEVMNGKRIYDLQYGAKFNGVLKTAILRTANLIPSTVVLSKID